MPRINPIIHAESTGKAKELLDGVNKKFGFVPNMLATMANAPAVLQAYLNFSDALAHGTLSAKVREQIAIAVAEANTCDYCASAHRAIGKMVGLPDSELDAGRKGASQDARVDTILKLAQRVVLSKGRLTNDEVAKARAAGLTDAELEEIVANVVLNILTNYLNHLMDPQIDFPQVVRTGEAA